MKDKDTIRYEMKIKRRYFSGYRRETSNSFILENFLNAFSSFNSFLIYNSFGTEADTHALINALTADGKSVYLPRVEGETLCAVPCGKTVKGAYGIDEPVGQAYFGDIDVTVIPLLAVNEKGYRIGYGKGYYDRYLIGRHTKKVGLGYFFQIENFEESAHDIPLDLFVCERGIYNYAADKK